MDTINSEQTAGEHLRRGLVQMQACSEFSQLLNFADACGRARRRRSSQLHLD